MYARAEVGCDAPPYSIPKADAPCVSFGDGVCRRSRRGCRKAGKVSFNLIQELVLERIKSSLNVAN